MGWVAPRVTGMSSPTLRREEADRQSGWGGYRGWDSHMFPSMSLVQLGQGYPLLAATEPGTAMGSP